MSGEDFAEKIRTISIGGARRLDSDGSDAFKRKLDEDLTDLSKDSSISPAIADAQAAIAGLCAPVGKQEKPKGEI